MTGVAMPCACRARFISISLHSSAVSWMGPMGVMKGFDVRFVAKTINKILLLSFL